MKWQVHADGSFDLESQAGALRNAWPGIDHQDVRCARVDVSEEGDGYRIVYHLASGMLTLTLGKWEDGLSLGCVLQGVTQAPHWLHPIHAARPEGFSGLFRQGIGFSGPTGLIRFAREEGPFSYESYLLLALLDEKNTTLTVAPHAHREYPFKAQVYTRLFRANFRNREIEDSIAFVEAGFRTERVAVNGNLELPTLYFQEGAELFDTLRATARAIADAVHVQVQTTPRYHYCSAYYHGPNFTRALLDDLLAGLERVDPKKHLQAVQIDDWTIQSRGDWLTFKQHLFPGGIEPAFRAISRAGYTPGIWVAPFMVGESSRLAQEHPDWLLRWKDGSLVTPWKNCTGEASPDFEHYVLDTSHPAALAWVREVFRTLHGWGARLFKTDFLEWGFRDSTKVLRHTPGKSSSQYFDEVMSAIREEIGPESYWLGCITYFAPSIGYMDGMRMTSDVGPEWAAVGGIGNDGVGGGIPNMIEESYATLYMNNVFWQNDPDVVFVRDRRTRLSEAQFRSLAAWHALLGHSVNTSDHFGELSEPRLAWWRWMRPQAEPWTARLPYYGLEYPFRVAVRDYPQANGQAVLVLNDRSTRASARIPIRELTGQERASVHRWEPGTAEPLGDHEELWVELDPCASMLVFVSRDGAPPPVDLNLGGSWG
jgi:hypothetical protein